MIKVTDFHQYRRSILSLDLMPSRSFFSRIWLKKVIQGDGNVIMNKYRQDRVLSTHRTPVIRLTPMNSGA